MINLLTSFVYTLLMGHEASSSYYMNSASNLVVAGIEFLVSKKNDYPLHATLYSGTPP